MQIALTPEQFAAAVARLKKDHKISATVPSGQIKRNGVTVTYLYDGQTTLHVNVLAKPFYCSESYLEGQISAWFAAASPTPTPAAA